MDANVAELSRLLENLIRLGTIVEVNGTRARVQSGKLKTQWLHWQTSRAGEAVTWWQPSIGEQVVLLSPGGDMAAAVILPSIYSDKHPSPTTNPKLHATRYPDGAQTSYDSESHTLDIVLPAGGTIHIHANGGNIVVHNGDIIVDGKSFKHHVHVGVVPGPADTGEPK